VDVGAALIADEQAAALVQPCEGAFDDPAVAAEPRAVPAEAACDYWFDPARPELAAVGVMVIAAVGNDTIGSAARAAKPAATDGTRSTSGSNWVTSLRLPPVSVHASGMPLPSVRR
jgi:hypothetical protein